MALDELKTQRKVIKYSITRHQTAVNAFKEGSNVVTLETRLSDLSELFKKYNAIQSDIESLQFKELSDRDDFDEAAWDAGNDKERTGVENQYYEVVAKIKTFLLKTDTCTGPGGSTTVININKSASDSNENVTNLKPLPLPVFSGKLSEWYNFYDSFKSLVHDDKTISDIRKFHYLRGCLKDEAFRAIESLTISNDNYVTALELLIKRFENKRLIVNEHVLNILNITPLMKSSHVELRQLLDAVNNNIAALKVLELPVDQWDALLIPIITEKLDYATKREWQTVLNKEVPKYVDFNEFLEKRYQILEALTTIKPQISNNSKPTNTFKNNNNSNNNKYGNNRSFSNHLVYKPTCSFCKKGHSIYQCDDFLKRTVVERLNEISKLQMCENCLRTNHKAEQCKSKSLCKICREKHHTLLHINEFNPTQTSLYTVGPSQVLLSTVTVLIADRHGNFHKCRGLLDQGSQANILTSKMCKKLGLFTTKVATSLTGINSRAISINEGVKVTIKSLASDFASNINCLIVPKITEPTPSFSFPKQLIKVPTNVTPSDQDFNSPKDIDLLIGAGLYWDLLIGAAFQLEVNQPFWQNTKLGFVVGGNFMISVTSVNNNACNLLSSKLKEGDLELCLESLWLDEEIEGGTTLSGDHLRCETHFGENYARSSHGQFIVKFPFMENTQLGNSYDMALNRYLGLERKLGKNPSLKEAYVGFMNEYLNLGHMEPAAIKHLEGDNIYYLPHHAVFKNTISGPKIRVVFDASAPTSNGLSLNDILLTGPTLQQDLFSILCRFRTYKYVVSADITKMYRMILMHENDRDFQRILWRNEVSEPVQIYRLNTVTYGTTCAPFLAVRCLFQLALEAENDFPLASNIIKRDFYMDDLLSGSNSKEEALLIKGQVTKILKKGGFNLCKWTSNLDELSAEGDHSTAINLNKGDYKILGFHWNCTDDQLKYNVNIQQISTDNITKRGILSTVSKIFDPLGLINPIVVKVKILLQLIWSQKLEWDDPLPQEIKDVWLKFVNDLSEVNNLRISRNLIPSYPYLQIEIHGFADASVKAYGACVYLRVIDSSQKITVNLLCAKSRVAPLKTISLPRLELNAAVLLIKLVNKVIKTLNTPFHKQYLWSDSTIVLAWLAEPPHHWKQYVGNRVAKIQGCSTRDDWNHVRSGDNPADIVSRGASPSQLRDSRLWWHGPQWLSQRRESWPQMHSNSISSELTDERRSVLVNVVNVASNSEWSVMTKFSTFTRLQRVIAFCIRFINILKQKRLNLDRTLIQNESAGKHNHNPVERSNKRKQTLPKTITCSPLLISELNAATEAIVKHMQLQSFSSGIISKKLASLDPFLDDRGILRVGGRIKHSPIPYDNKHPMLLPESHNVTKLIIKYFHEQQLHAGSQATLAAIRQRFWPVGGRNSVRKIIHSCFKCNRAHPKITFYKMGDLPKQRVEPSRPFYVSGVDYAGPFLIKDGRTRTQRRVKAYIALFVCFATKAVHLELVGDLTTDSFLAAMKRFTSRRGNVRELFCDNGTNFVGAERALFNSRQFENKLANHFSEKGTSFHFIPARSPHFGGLWERAVRSVKHHLFRVVGDASLTYEEFYTFLVCIEACLNSRPLTPLSPDPNDLNALTPGHLLIGAPLTNTAEEDVTPLPINRLSRWQRVQQLHQQFWKRWTQEYLSELQRRPKGQQSSTSQVAVGSLVVIIEDNLPPLKWKLGRVLQLHPGLDGVVRVVTVKTSTGVYKRTIKKVCLLPADAD